MTSRGQPPPMGHGSCTSRASMHTADDEPCEPATARADRRLTWQRLCSHPMVQRTAVNWLGIVFRGVRFGLKRATLHGRPFLIVETALCAAHKLCLELVLRRPHVSEAVGALSIQN